MAILTVDDFTTKDLQKAVVDTPRYLEIAQTYYESLLDELGIELADAPLVAHNITKETVLFYTSKRICADLKGYTYRQVADGVQEDPYKVKYDDYNKEWLMWKTRITFDILMKRKPSKGTASGVIYRS